MPVASQVFFQPGNCLNIKKPFATTCWECFQKCPHGAINEIKKIDPNKCTDCGVCMAVCPSDGFVDRAMDEIKRHMFDADPVVLSCPAARPGGCEISCVGMFDRDAWGALMLLSDRKEVNILTGDCAVCEDVKACSHSVSTLKALLEHWTPPNNMKIKIVPWDGQTTIRPDEQASLDTAAADPPTPSSNMPADPPTIGELREQNKLRDKLKAMLPVLAEETYNIPRSRRWLLDALALAPGHKIPFQALKINEQCTSCGICAHVCPQGALTHNKDNGVERIVYQPSLCVHCQRCLKVCGPKAVAMEEMALDERYIKGKILLRKIIPRLCASCGRQIFHNLEPGLCIGCAREDPELKGILY
ncbi:MAG: 4Fe-4S binding protein [Gracilibacteraceae bacterium]|nr:4Fe-4S binding protein [Gracilibacteraceae bacterium]